MRAKCFLFSSFSRPAPHNPKHPRGIRLVRLAVEDDLEAGIVRVVRRKRMFRLVAEELRVLQGVGDFFVLAPFIPFLGKFGINGQNHWNCLPVDPNRTYTCVFRWRI